MSHKHEKVSLEDLVIGRHFVYHKTPSDCRPGDPRVTFRGTVALTQYERGGCNFLCVLEMFDGTIILGTPEQLCT